MRLKCIKLAGFKSFVDPTTISFPSDLCSVVGPNGCGKSNVIDAVRWVMGESSAKNLRGENMTDVIFNGSGARKPVGQASVELVFDNHDKKLAGEYAGFAEVSIKRRVDRDAQSTYFLNGSKCRRRDITDIFLGTGLGARSYSIIEQGMVSRLIESKPEELRVYIEEAAGISKYKERRRETENRIKRTRENLERLTDIRDELERQLQHLKRQSVAAEKYGEFKQQERQTAANLNALKWRSLDAEIRENQDNINKLELQIESAVADQRGIDANIEKLLADNADLNDELGEVQARYYSLGNDIARIEQSIEHHLERVEQWKLDLSETEEGWEQTREELDVDLRKITQFEAELKDLNPRLEQAREEETLSAEQLGEAEHSLQGWQEEWDAFNQRAEEPKQTAEVEQSRIQQLEQIVERGLERKQKLEAEQSQLDQEPVDEALESQAQEITRLEAEIGSQREQSASLGEQLEQNREALSACLEELDATRAGLQREEGKLASLEALQQAALGQDNEALNKWLKSKGLNNQLRLAESLQIDSGWELAVETVLGDSMRAICVEGLDQVEAMLVDLPKGKLAFIDVNASGSEATPSAEFTPLLARVSSDYDVSELLAGIYIAESLSDAVAMRERLGDGESVITRNGIWLGKSWLQLQSTSTRESVALRRTQIAELFKKTKTLREQADSLQSRRDELRARTAECEQQREALQQDIAEQTQQLGEMKSKMSGKLAQQEEAKRRRERVAQELEDLVQQIAIEQENTATARARLQTALDSMEQDVGGRESLESAREQLNQSLQQARYKARADKDVVHEMALKQQSLQSQLQSTKETMDRMASQVQRSKERMESLRRQIEESEQPLKGMRAELEGLLEKRLEVEKELTSAKTKVDENEHAMREAEKRRNEIQEQLNSVREELMQNRLRGEGATVKREAILEQLAEAKYDLETVLKNLPEDLDIASCETELEKLGNRIQRLGPINLAAIDEYQQQSERKVYLDKQNEDLEKALLTLRNAIKKIDKETRTRFKETFDKINSGLQSLFPRIFGGGHAYLDMTGEDLLDTGIAIMARPPGKRNSTIHLLSGGEKAMTAIALVFSIFHLNPSPFCMLDEVDAPLDDANVGRYANLVKEMSKNVQFIFITHNKITMEMANQLLGVTMHEPGVSRIVAVDIDEAAELAAM